MQSLDGEDDKDNKVIDGGGKQKGAERISTWVASQGAFYQNSVAVEGGAAKVSTYRAHVPCTLGIRYGNIGGKRLASTRDFLIFDFLIITSLCLRLRL